MFTQPKGINTQFSSFSYKKQVPSYSTQTTSKKGTALWQDAPLPTQDTLSLLVFKALPSTHPTEYETVREFLEVQGVRNKANQQQLQEFRQNVLTFETNVVGSLLIGFAEEHSQRACAAVLVLVQSEEYKEFFVKYADQLDTLRDAKDSQRLFEILLPQRREQQNQMVQSQQVDLMQEKQTGQKKDKANSFGFIKKKPQTQPSVPQTAQQESLMDDLTKSAKPKSNAFGFIKSKKEEVKEEAAEQPKQKQNAFTFIKSSKKSVQKEEEVPPTQIQEVYTQPPVQEKKDKKAFNFIKTKKSAPPKEEGSTTNNSANHLPQKNFSAFDQLLNENINFKMESPPALDPAEMKFQSLMVFEKDAVQKKEQDIYKIYSNNQDISSQVKQTYQAQQVQSSEQAVQQKHQDAFDLLDINLG